MDPVTVSVLVANFIALCGLFYRASIIHFKVDELWRDYCKRHGINGPKGKSNGGS